MPKGVPNGKPNEMADALVGLVHAGQSLRRAGRGRAVGIAKEATSTLGRVLDAIGDL